MARHMYFCGQPNFSLGKYILNLTCLVYQIKSVGLSAALHLFVVLSNYTLKWLQINFQPFSLAWWENVKLPFLTAKILKSQSSLIFNTYSKSDIYNIEFRSVHVFHLHNISSWHHFKSLQGSPNVVAI